MFKKLKFFSILFCLIIFMNCNGRKGYETIKNTFSVNMQEIYDIDNFLEKYSVIRDLRRYAYLKGDSIHYLVRSFYAKKLFLQYLYFHKNDFLEIRNIENRILKNDKLAIYLSSIDKDTIFKELSNVIFLQNKTGIISSNKAFGTNCIAHSLKNGEYIMKIIDTTDFKKQNVEKENDTLIQIQGLHYYYYEPPNIGFIW